MKTKVNEKQIKQELEKFNIKNVGKILLLENVGADNYLINWGEKKYLLRLNGDKSSIFFRTKNDVASEIEILKKLLSQGIEVPVVLSDKFGKQLISIGGRNGFLRKYIVGSQKSSPSLEEIEQAGKMLGKMHKVLQNWKSKYKRKDWGLGNVKKFWFGNKKIILSSNFKNRESFVKKFEEILLDIKLPNILPAGTLHEDFGKRHLLWKSKRIAGVIDFDRAYYGPLILDLGQALRGWCFSRDWKKWSARKAEAFLRGYESLICQML